MSITGNLNVFPFSLTGLQNINGTINGSIPCDSITIAGQTTFLSASAVDVNGDVVLDLHIQDASATATGLLTSTNFNIFNNKQDTITASAPLDFSQNIVSIRQSSTSTDGYLSSSNFNIFNDKAGLATNNTFTGTNNFQADVSFNQKVSLATTKKLCFKTNDNTTEYITYDLNSSGLANGMIMNTLTGIELRQNNNNILSLSNSTVQIFQHLSLGSLTNNTGGATGLQLFGRSTTSVGIRDMTITQHDANAPLDSKNWQMTPNNDRYNYFTVDDNYQGANTYLSFIRNANGSGVDKTLITCNNVGINKVNPSATLDVVGTANISGTSYFASNVGIGTSSPASKLHVGDGGASLGTNIARIDQGDGSYNSVTDALQDPFSITSATSSPANLTIGMGVDTTSKVGYINVAESGSLRPLFLNCRQSAPVIALGNVGIGNTNPSYKLDITGTMSVSSTAYFAGNVGIGTSSPAYELDVDGNIQVHQAIRYINNSSAKFFTFQTNNTGSIVLLDQSGTGVFLTSGTTAWAGTSDIRLKKNIESMDCSASYNNILNLNPVYYNFTNEASGSKLRGGLIAQEVLPYFPDIVCMNGEHYGIQYTEFIPHLISSIKEQAKIIKEDKERIATLEERLLKIEKLLDLK